jgi:hypothetical protein
MLAIYREAGVELEWVACPDVVGKSRETLALWPKWKDVIRAFGYRPALVLQDGMSLGEVDMRNPPALFIGGTTEYKLSETVREIVAWMGKRRIPIHMGRVNTQKRIEYAYQIGCTSCDGSGFSKWPDTRIPMGIRWIKKAKEPTLLGDKR